MKSGFVKIGNSFNITGIGILVELQHYENGIPPNTKIIDLNSEISWIVVRRVLLDTLLVTHSEVIFDCETKLEYIKHSYKSDRARQTAVEKEKERRKSGIYWYVIKPENEHQKLKPEIGTELKIIKDKY